MSKMELVESNLEDEIAKKLEELELSLPREKSLTSSPFLYFYQNFWCPSLNLRSVISFQAHFQAQDTDILLVTKPKSGTTWLKALAFTILNRRIYGTKQTNLSNPHPLVVSGPHTLVPFLEYTVYSENHLPNLSNIPPPRIFATHIPYHSLPDSIKSSGCRIVYMCRNILDTTISLWKFSSRVRVLRKKQEGEEEATKLEEVLDSICRGVEEYGPHWDHVLEYWRESLKRPEMVLFMKYEDMKKDDKLGIKRLAEFMGCPFTLEEEECGIIEEISYLCSFEHLKELEVNKTGKSIIRKVPSPNNIFFRKGEVGDWANYLSPAMVERLNEVMQEKFHGSGLTFKMN